MLPAFAFLVLWPLNVAGILYHNKAPAREALVKAVLDYILSEAYALAVQSYTDDPDSEITPSVCTLKPKANVQPSTLLKFTTHTNMGHVCTRHSIYYDPLHWPVQWRLVCPPRRRPM